MIVLPLSRSKKGPHTLHSLQKTSPELQLTVILGRPDTGCFERKQHTHYNPARLGDALDISLIFIQRHDSQLGFYNNLPLHVLTKKHMASSNPCTETFSEILASEYSYLFSLVLLTDTLNRAA